MFSYKWIAVGLCFAILFLAMGSNMAFAVFLSPMSRDLGWSIPSLALTMTIALLVSGFSLPIMGRMADKYGARIMILAGAAVSGASILLLAFVSSLWQIYLLFGCLFGFTYNSCGLLATTALVSRWFVEGKNLALTVLQSAFPMGWLFIVPIAEGLISSYGWRNSWVVLGAAILFVVSIAGFLLKEPKESDANMSRDHAGITVPLGTALKTSFFLMLGVVVQFFCGATDLPFTLLWVPLSLEWGVNEVVASYTLGFMAVAVLLGTITIGPLPKRFGNKLSFTALYIVRTAAFVLPLLVKSTITYYAFTALLGFSFFGMVPVTSAWLGEALEEKSVGSLLGFAMFMHFIGAGVGISVFSFLAVADKTYYPAFVSSFVLTLLTVVTCCLIKPPKIKV